MANVKVAVFRAEADHLFRLANVDYSACVGPEEKRNWKAIAKRALAEAETMTCNRANENDEKFYIRAKATLSIRMVSVPD